MGDWLRVSRGGGAGGSGAGREGGFPGPAPRAWPSASVSGQPASRSGSSPTPEWVVVAALPIPRVKLAAKGQTHTASCGSGAVLGSSWEITDRSQQGRCPCLHFLADRETQQQVENGFLPPSPHHTEYLLPPCEHLLLGQCHRCLVSELKDLIRRTLTQHLHTGGAQYVLLEKSLFFFF